MPLKLLKYAKIIIIVFLFGCGEGVPDFELVEQDPKVTIHYSLMNGLDAVDIGDSFTDAQGHHLILKTMKMYVSNMSVVSKGQSQELTEVELVNFNENQDGQTNPFVQAYTYIIEPMEIEQIRLSIGLSEDVNSTDPTLLPKDDPLSANAGMYWDWGSKYIFVMLEAGIDLNGDGQYDDDIGFHTGLDELYIEDTESSIVLDLKSFDKDSINIQIDWNTVFPGPESEGYIDLNEAPFVHASGDAEKLELARVFTQNFRRAIGVK